MKNRNDFGALNWIKDELDVTIKKARVALEAHVESEAGFDSLIACKDYLHQIAGVLRMAQVHGPGMLAEDMEATIQAMVEGKVRHKDDAAEALMLALIQLPDYLEKIQGGDIDIPLILLPLLNDLRAVRDDTLLQEIDLFTPNIDQAEVTQKILNNKNPNLPTIVRPLRQKFHIALINWFTKKEAESAWRLLLEIFDELKEHAGTKRVHNLAWISSALIHCLIDNSITPDESVKQIFGKLDRQLKSIIDNGETAQQDDQLNDLLRNLLFYVAHADSQDETVTAVKKVFNLEDFLTNEEEINKGRQGLSGSNAELAASISDAIQSELTKIKDILDLFMRKDRAESDMIMHLERPMRQLADTLGMVGQNDLRTRLLRQAEKVHSFVSRDTAPEEYELMEMAGDILYVESSLGALKNIQSGKNKHEKNNENIGIRLPVGEYGNLIKQTVNEARHDIAKAKEAIITFTQNPNETNVLIAVHDGFIRICGALKLLEFMDVAGILEQTSEYIQIDLIDRKQMPERQQLNYLADVISSIEYFLEAMVDGGGNRSEIVGIAQKALDGLLSLRTAYDELTINAEIIPITRHAKKQNTKAEVQPNDIEYDESGLSNHKKENIEDTNIEESEVTKKEDSVISQNKAKLEDIDSEILEIFIEEAREELEVINQHYPQWRENHENKEALICFRRSFHTLKGSGRMVGAQAIGELAWSVENMLNRVIDETIDLSSEITDLLDAVIEALPSLIECQEHAVPINIDYQSLIKSAFDLTSGQQEIKKITDSQDKDIDNEITNEHIDIDADINHEINNESREIDACVEDIVSFEREDLLNTQENEEGSTGNSVSEVDNYQHEFSDSEITIELDSELLDVFAKESESHLEVLENFIKKAKSSNLSLSITDEIIRAYHTMHGSARMTGISSIANLSKAVENYLKILNERNHQLDERAIRLIEDSVNYIHKILIWIENGNSQEPNADSYITRLLIAQEDVLKENHNYKELNENEGITINDESVPPLQDIQIHEHNLSQIDGKSESNQVFELDEETRVVKIFKEKAKELLDGVNENFNCWKQDQENIQSIEQLIRDLHALNGSASLAEITPIAELGQALENAFRKYVELDLKESQYLFDAFKDSLRLLAEQIEQVQSHNSVNWANEPIINLKNLFEERIDQSVGQQNINGIELISNFNSTSQFLHDENSNYITEPSLDDHLNEKLCTDEKTSVIPERYNIEKDDEYFEAGGDPELLEIFIEEAKDLLESLESSYQKWYADQNDKESLPQLKRTLHTIKGSARLAGVLPIGDLSHALETVFNNFDEGHANASDEVLSIIRQSIDMLAYQVEEVETFGKVHHAIKLISLLESSHNRNTVKDKAQETSQLSLSEDKTIGESEAKKKEDKLLGSIYLQNIKEEKYDVGEDPELVEIFIEEGKEILEQLETSLQNWFTEPNDLTELEGIQRSLHTLKGSARLAGITPIGNLSHAFESLLTGLVNHNVQINDDVIEISRQALDKLAAQIDEISAEGKVTTEQALIEGLEKLVDPDSAGSKDNIGLLVAENKDNSRERLVKVKHESAIVLPFNMDEGKNPEPSKQKTNSQYAQNKDQVRINAELMDRLVNNAGEVSIYRARLEQQNNILGFNLSELDQTVSRLFTQLRNLEIETEAQILYRWDRDNEKDDRERAEFDPLELDRFSIIQQLSRALAETVSDLGSIYEALVELQRETDTLLLQQSRISTDLQDGLLRTRMVPFSQLAPRMQRLVRQTADQLGKKAQLEVFGSEGELDRNILNRMVPVLEHLLRNAVSHGIEFPKDRKMVGKPEVGQISLTIDREATDVLITLADDGRGLDFQAIRTKAIRQGMIDENAQVKDEDLIQCVLNPGFSTATEVTQISGRGVGLDVVASEVKQLSGSLDIVSKTAEGTRFIVRLPLTLAITDALLVRVGEEIYAIPHGSVEGVVRIKRDELESCYLDDKHAYQYADKKYKTIYLGRMMGVEPPELPDGVKWFPLLLVHTGEHHVALQVDELLGTRQVVVKSVGKQVGSVRWVTGGTILADGRVALILDVGALVRMDAARISVESADTPQLQAQKDPEIRIRVMVVDDSITVRKVTGRLLERHDMEVVTAKDGVEAIALLQEQLPDIMLLDIEMPRMDGFEVARHINNSVDYYGLPIIMITSRVGEKHRQRAFKLGVKRCLGKPYQEAELLENIHEVLAEVKA